MSDLRILDMSVTWRNILDFGTLTLGRFKNKKKIEEDLREDKVIPKSSELYELMNKVSGTVCSLIAPKTLFLPLFPFEVYHLANVNSLSEEEQLKQLEKAKWRKIYPFLLLHKSGVGTIKCVHHFDESLSTRDAVHAVRMGIKNLFFKVPSSYKHEVSQASTEYMGRLKDPQGETYLLGNLRDFCSDVLRHYIRNHIGKKHLDQDFGDKRIRRCISSTLIEVYKTDPHPESINDFVKIENFGRQLRGVGSMDLAYENRADRLVESTFETNLSQDEELHFYLMGLSDFIIYDKKIEEVVPQQQKRLGYESEFHVKKYISYHYECLLDWVYMEQFILRMYDMLLSWSMSQEEILPEEMLDLQKSSMRDLIEYNEGITPFSTRADILDKARLMYRLPEEQERLEKKRDMVIEYVMQEYSLRTNRGIQLLNFIISATVSFELMQLVMDISSSDSPSLWGSLSTIVFLTLVILFYFFYIRIVSRK